MKKISFYVLFLILLSPIFASDTLTVNLSPGFTIDNFRYDLKTFEFFAEKSKFQNTLSPKLNFSPGFHPNLNIKAKYKFIEFDAILTISNEHFSKHPFHSQATLINKDHTERTYFVGDWMYNYSSSEKRHKENNYFSGYSQKLKLNLHNNVQPFFYYSSSKYRIGDFGEYSYPFFDTLEIGSFNIQTSILGVGVHLTKNLNKISISTLLQYGKALSAKTVSSPVLITLHRENKYAGYEFGLGATIFLSKFRLEWNYHRFTSDKEKFTISSNFISLGLEWNIIKLPVNLSEF